MWKNLKDRCWSGGMDGLIKSVAMARAWGRSALGCVASPSHMVGYVCEDVLSKWPTLAT